MKTPDELANAAELRERFAVEWLKSGDPVSAAWRVFPVATMGWERAYISDRWTRDEAVLEACERFAEVTATPGDMLPTKEGFARKILEESSAWEPDDKVKAWKLYADVMGLIEKPGTTINNTLANHVMVVKDFGTDEQWERHAAEQQRKLIETSRAN